MSFSDAIKKAFRPLVKFFSSHDVVAELNKAAQLAIEVAPYLDMATKIAAGLLPAPAGLITLAVLKGIEANYPQLFNGSLKTKKEIDLFKLGVAGDLVQKVFPGVDTTTARTALQLAFLNERNKTPLVVLPQ